MYWMIISCISEEKQLQLMHNFMHLLEGEDKNPAASKDVKRLCGQMMDNFLELQKLEKEAESEEEKKYLTTYLKILQQIATETLTAKVKYRTLNRQALTSQRLSGLSSEIDTYREYQKRTDKELKEIEQQLKKYHRDNAVVQFQNQCLKKAIERKEQKMKESKSFYLTCGENGRRRDHSEGFSRMLNEKIEIEQATRGVSAESSGRRTKTAKVVSTTMAGIMEDLADLCVSKPSERRSRIYWTKKNKPPFGGHLNKQQK